MCEMNENKEKIIEQLTQEITTTSNYVLTFRSKIAFTILIGPFVILGSFIIACKGELPNITNSWAVFTGAAIASIAYFGLGIYGALLDYNASVQCNEWRKEIAAVANNERAEIAAVQTTLKLKRAYSLGLFLVWVALLGVIYLLSGLGPVNKEELKQDAIVAKIQDHMLIHQGKKQIYGTQYRTNLQGGLELYPIEDEANVDMRRGEVGLGPISETLARMRVSPEGKADENSEGK